MSIRLAHPTELPELAQKLSRQPLLTHDFERGTELAAQRLEAALSHSEVWVLPHGVAYVSDPHQLHAFYFDGVLRATPLRAVMQFYRELTVLIPEYAAPVIRWVQRKLGFSFVRIEPTLALWQGRTWPVHRLTWERKE